MKLPTVVIVGRPNVGKSSLFNRIIGKRLSIIHKSPGVTRDRNYHDVCYNGYNFAIVDTGGIEEEKSSLFIEYIIEQTKKAIEEADLILFLVESTNIVPDDYKIAELLRQQEKPVILVVNKTDNDQRQDPQGYLLGFKELIYISATHGINVYELLERSCSYINKIELAEEDEGEEQKGEEDEGDVSDDELKVAIIGRPNVGKSSLLNKILGEERSLVSEIAGTTRDSISARYKGYSHKFTFVDTAGIRKRSRVDNEVEYYSVKRAIQSLEKSDIGIHMISSLESICEQDKKIISLAVERGKALVIAINKWDLVSGSTNYAKYVDKIRFKFAIGNYIPIINISAKTGLQINKLFEIVIKVWHQYNKKVETRALNRLLVELQKKHNISSKKSGALKIYYGTQINVSPPRFLLFINKKELLTKNYKAYIINMLRKSFNFEGVPIEIYSKRSS